MSAPQSGDTVTVSVKSAWQSKINWTQAVAAAAMVIGLITGGKLELTGDEQAAIVVVIGVIGNLITFVMKTWFTPTITPASAKS